VFNFDTPWHPDDYVHRIGRTGRGGASGRAFTFVAPEDAEAIDNVEKLTGGKIPLFEVSMEGGERQARDERSPRRDREPRQDREARPAREPRQEREPRPEREPRHEREPRAPRPERQSRPEHAPRRERDDRRDNRREDEAGEPGWGGPVPDFLGFSALG
jgi:superfamily II DNA/RNA helicase